MHYVSIKLLKKQKSLEDRLSCPQEQAQGK